MPMFFCEYEAFLLMVTQENKNPCGHLIMLWNKNCGSIFLLLFPCWGCFSFIIYLFIYDFSDWIESGKNMVESLLKSRRT
jgi:hypothetical protein